MNKSFMSAMTSTLNHGAHNESYTENGALGYRTTGKALLDLNFSVPALRKMTDEEVYHRFSKAFFEDKVIAMKWLFFARDVRGGLGERRLFRTVISFMAESNPEYLIPLLDLIPEYGRYDDLWCLLDTPLRDNVVQVTKKQFVMDVKAYQSKRSVSLLAKWMPSANASSPKTRRYARILIHEIGTTERDYRKTLSRLRAYIDIVERKMSEGQWENIKYEGVPSRANLKYNKAFLRNDEIRRRAFLESLSRGETTINASTLYPHDIVTKYMNNGAWRSAVKSYDATLEALWNALPDTVEGCGNTIVVADGSGSMTSRISNAGRTSALDVANALAIYFAERSSGQFKDQYMTFSMHPQLVDLSGGKNLREKLQIALEHCECSNTNIEAVFDLILATAKNNMMTQDEMPQNILIISDMEFDSCVSAGPVGRNRWTVERPTEKLFDTFRKRYERAGYQLPRLVFWNVNSRTGTIPMTENDLGVALVSGFSTNIVKMVMSGQTDPYDCLLETLNSERYAPVEAALTAS